MADEIITNVIPNMKAVDLGDGTFAYAVIGEESLDRGVATAGSPTTLVDATKNWTVNEFFNTMVEVTITNIEYHRLIASNTATTLTFAALPALISVAAGNPYLIRIIGGNAVTIADGADVTQGAIADVAVAAGAAGSVSSKLRRLTTDLGDGIVDLAAIEIINTAIQTAVQGMQAVDGAVGVAADVDGVRQGQLRYIGEQAALIVAAVAAGGVGDYATPTHTWPVIANATTVALAANANRLYACLVNDGTEPIYIKLGVAAVMNQGIRLNAAGGSYEMSREIGNLYVGAINGICASGGMTLVVTEGV